MVNQVISLLAFIDHFKDEEQDALAHFVRPITLLSGLLVDARYF